MGDAIDYTTVQATVRSVIEGAHRHLIEALAEDIAQKLLSSFPARAVVVDVLKPSPPVDFKFAGVRVRIRRHSRPAFALKHGTGPTGFHWRGREPRRSLARDLLGAGKLAETPGLADVLPSPVFETDPVGFLNQPLFFNLVVGD